MLSGQRLHRAMAPLAALAAAAFAAVLPTASPAQAPAAPQPAAVRAAKPFVSPSIAKDAERYETTLKQSHKAGKAKAGELKAAGEKALASDPRAAMAQLGQAVVLAPRDADAWLGLARALLAAKPATETSPERYSLPLNAGAAAYTAYQRATTPAAQARALVVLSEALKRRSQWRPAIEALRTSLALSETTEARKSFEALVAAHGFRVTQHKLDVDGTAPRLCVQFSETLARGDIDWSKFLLLDGRSPQSVTADAKQLCIEGLKHGQRYTVQVRAGLPSAVGEDLAKTAEISAYVRDRAASVRFSGRSYVLPSRGQQGIPVVSINAAAAAVEVYRIGDRSLAGAVQGGDFQKQLYAYDLEQMRERTGQRVYAGELEIASKLNEEVTTAFPVSEAIPRLQPGVYAMVARPAGKSAEDDNGWATQWFVVSDLGLTALSGDDGIHAFVRSLATAQAVRDATVRLVARNNEVLGTARTDAAGYARFDAGLRRGEGGLAPAILVVESGGVDYAFLDMTTAAFDLADRGVKGRAAPGALDAFLFAERGVYRPGEDVHLTALVRDKAARAATLPVTLIVTRPDGVEHRRLVLADQGLGGRLTTLALSGSAMTGTWRAKLHADPKAGPLAQVAFLVEDFVPERLDLKLDAAGKVLRTDAPASIGVAGRYLYGPPAAGLAVEGDIVVKAASRDAEGLAGYRFGQADEKVAPLRKPLEGLPSTGADGNVALAIALPAVPRTARPLEADVIVRLREPGGRTIERVATLPVDLRLARIGIKPAFGGDGPAEGETAGFDLLALGADGKPVERELTWRLLRLETTWQWFKQDGRWSWEAATHKRLVTSGKALTAAGQPARIAARIDYGRYQLEVADAAAPDMLPAGLAFQAGWHAAEDAADSPEMLEVALDKPSYRPGETARLRIATRQGGKANIAVLASGLLSSREVDVAPGRTEVTIPVGDDWGAGAYVTATLYRPMDEQARRMPTRAVGIAWLGLDQSQRTLKMALEAPARIKSGGLLSVPVKLTGLAAGEEARITVAAVDVGILNLTRYQAPQPEGWFYAQRQLGIEIRDYYGRLIDGMRAERGKLRSGGDGASGMSTQGSPPVEKLVALHSGIVRVGPDGAAKVEFQLPDFNGAVRVTGVAWSGDKLGSASTDVIVRDPIAMLATGPRFITLGDEARLTLDLHNVEGSEASYKVAVTHEAGGTRASVLARDVTLKAGERRQERLAVTPAAIGISRYKVQVTGPGGIDVGRELTFDVKVPAGDIRRVTVSRLAPGGRLTLSQDLAQDLIPGRTRIALSVGPHATLDVPGLLAALDRYPYGCAEQTVSRALPLLYANAVAQRVGIAADRELRERVAKAVDRVLEMQDASGAFGIWGPWNADMWLTSYVTDFLTRAKEAGVAVKAQSLNQALDRLQAYLSYAQDFEKGGEARAYAVYVLARNGRAPTSELRYFVDARLDRFSTPLAQAHLGAALALTGDKARAEQVLRTAMASLDASKDDAMREDYGSRLRDGAALLTLVSETNTLRSEAPRLLSVVNRAQQGRTYTSTQEMAWMLLAAHSLEQAAKDTTLTVAGQPHRGPLVRALTEAELKGGALVIANGGSEAVDAVVSVTGAALTPEPAISRGFTIERSAYTLDGKKVDLPSLTGGSGQLSQNDRLVMVLKVESKETGGRILLVDRLPAGLEIENPRIVDSGDIKSLDWLKTTVKPEHTEFRDDRFVAAFNFFGGNVESRRRGGGEGGDSDDEEGKKREPASAATVAYIVRAVSPGRYVHPAATVEDMYRPERYARTAAGRLEVKD